MNANPATISDGQRDWLISQYETVRNEIAARASIHHSMLAWSAAIVAAVFTIFPDTDGTQRDLWIAFLTVLVLGSLVAIPVQIAHTIKLGRYARALELVISRSVGLDDGNPLQGWEVNLKRARR
jgi:hypothetical protein